MNNRASWDNFCGSGAPESVVTDGTWRSPSVQVTPILVDFKPPPGRVSDQTKIDFGGLGCTYKRVFARQRKPIGGLSVDNIVSVKIQNERKPQSHISVKEYLREW